VLIPSVQASLQDMQKNIDQLTGNAQAVLSNMQTMTGPQNQRNLNLLLANARNLLDRESPQINQVLQNLGRASLQAGDTLKQAGDTLNQINTAAQAANDMFGNANQALAGMREPMRTEFAALESTMAEARSLIADLSTVVSANRYNIDDTLENLRATSANLRDFTASVKQRPWTLIRGSRPASDRAVPVATARP
jgi:ABC-type transporter Mla subunit MlaD